MKKRADGRYVKKIKLQDGTYKYFYSNAETSAKAERDIYSQLLEYNGKTIQGKKLIEVSDEWEEQHYDKIAYSTARRYETYVKAFNDYFHDEYIRDISAIGLTNFMQYLSSQNYSTKTIKDQLSVIKQIFKFAVIHRYVDTDVSVYIVPTKGVSAKKRDALTENEMKTVENSINCTFGLLAYFLLYTGLRKGEALALQWKDIDFDNKVIHIYKSVYYESNKPFIKQPKTSAGKRDIILLDCLAEKLKKGNSNDFVFTHNNQLMDKSYFTREWEKYKNESGLKITAHQLRHTFATILFEAGLPEKDTQTLMGHSDIKVTQNIYTHIRQQRLNDTAKKLNDYMLSKSCQHQNYADKYYTK